MTLGAAESFGGFGGGYIPEKDGTVAANRSERGVVSRNADIEHLIAMSRICLNELSGFWRREGIRNLRGRAGRIVEADGPVRGAGQDIRRRRGGVREGVNRTYVCCKSVDARMSRYGGTG